MIKLLLCSVFSLLCCWCQAQSKKTDSLKNALTLHKAKDTALVQILYAYSDSLTNSGLTYNAMSYAQQGIELAKELKWDDGMVLGMLRLSELQSSNTKFDSAITTALGALGIAENINHDTLQVYAHMYLTDYYRLVENFSPAEYHAKQSLDASRRMKNERLILNSLLQLCFVYSDMKQPDKEDKYLDSALKTAVSQNNNYILTAILSLKAQRQYEKKDFREAAKNYRQVLSVYEKDIDYHMVAYIQANLSLTFTELKNKDSAAFYAAAALETSKSQGLKKEMFDAYNALFHYSYTFGDYKKAVEYRILRDSLDNDIHNIQAAKNIERTSLEYEQQKRDLISKTEQAKKDFAAKRTKNLQYLAIVIFIALAGFLFWNNRQKQKAKIKIEAAYAELKATQAQLIQSEKMASLGELTAGIAHEIQNPLNFVNNFSEVNTELLQELVEEAEKGNTQEVVLIAKDLQDNESKINHHGKRADAIVKGMLQHSRATGVAKEPTDINKLADEYLRLAYHGLRAKDKSFNATLKTDFDEHIGKVNVVPQDIGRVILNIINNAFYAVNEKSQQQIEGYEPTVSVSSKKTNYHVEIKVRDNGNGIPQKIVDKIFQPFFTTKPTGQGTGLGLSLSYDIVKAHGGELKVETNEGKGSDFIIKLPVA